MNVRRSVLLILSATMLALLIACSNDGGSTSDGDSSSGDDGPLGDTRATLQSVAKTAEAAGTKAAAGAGPRATDTPIPLSALTGEFEARFVFQGERPSSELRDALEMPDNLDVVIGQGIITVSGREPFVSVTGSLSDDGAISATGTGTNEEWGELTATLQGTLADASLAGTYTLTGAFPGGSLAFELTADFDG
jgi:hypothetical protein